MKYANFSGIFLADTPGLLYSGGKYASLRVPEEQLKGSLIRAYLYHTFAYH